MKAVPGFVAKFIVPGAVFQSIAIGGGYGTGREIVQYFTQYGMVGGILAIGVAAMCMAIVVGTTFEIARRFRLYDYRSYMDCVVGRFSVVYEVLAVTMLLIVLAVIGAAAGNILHDAFGAPVWAGVILMFIFVMALNYFGRRVVTGFLTSWSAILYLVFIAYFVVTLNRYEGALSGQLSLLEVKPGWALSGFKYCLYNVSVVPVMLYAVRALETRTEAVCSGALAAVITMVPGLLFHLSYASAYPAILDAPMPTHWMIVGLSLQPLMVVYVIVLFGTFIETCSGSMQGINERLDHWALVKRGKALSQRMHAMTAGSAILISTLLSTFGIVALIAHGYGTIAWGFFAVYVLPTLTIGVWRMRRGAGR
jgi:uncharacterized membrane protein YkvI